MPAAKYQAFCVIIGVAYRTRTIYVRHLQRLTFAKRCILQIVALIGARMKRETVGHAFSHALYTAMGGGKKIKKVVYALKSILEAF